MSSSPLLFFCKFLKSASHRSNALPAPVLFYSIPQEDSLRQCNHMTDCCCRFHAHFPALPIPSKFAFPSSVPVYKQCLPFDSTTDDDQNQQNRQKTTTPLSLAVSWFLGAWCNLTLDFINKLILWTAHHGLSFTWHIAYPFFFSYSLLCPRTASYLATSIKDGLSRSLCAPTVRQ